MATLDDFAQDVGIMSVVMPGSNPDRGIQAVEFALRAIPDVARVITEGIARAVDEVVDPIRSARWQLSQLDQPEKTVVGIRVENVLRMELELARPPRLDLLIAGENVDVKFTVNTNWAIPPEAVGEICLLTSFRERDHSVCAGLLRTDSAFLNPGLNRDRKRGISLVGKANIRWLALNQPSNTSMIGFMASLPPLVRASITDTGVGAQTRLNRLFLAVKNVPIPERLVEAVAQHRDWTRRMRPDASNRHAPGAGVGYEVLRQSSPDDRQRLRSEGRAPLAPGFCMSVDA